MCSNVATNISKTTYAQIMKYSTVAPTKRITGHTDTGASGIYLMRQTSLYTQKEPKLRAICPKRAEIISSESAQLDIPYLPKEATTARVFNNITSANLLSIKQICDSGFIAAFTETDVKIFNR